MQRRLDKYQNPQKAAEASKGNEANVQPVNLVWDEAREGKQIHALEMLLNDKFRKQSPLNDRLRHPASDPNHYDNVLLESERAPSRGLFTRIMDNLRGKIRLS